MSCFFLVDELTNRLLFFFFPEDVPAIDKSVDSMARVQHPASRDTRLASVQSEKLHREIELRLRHQIPIAVLCRGIDERHYTHAEVCEILRRTKCQAENAAEHHYRQQQCQYYRKEFPNAPNGGG